MKIIASLTAMTPALFLSFNLTHPLGIVPVMKARISSEDMQFLRRFSEPQKSEVMQRIMSRRPEKTVVMDGDNEFEKTLIRLRRDGYGLIDLQPQEAACSSIWYRRKPSLLKRSN